MLDCLVHVSRQSAWYQADGASAMKAIGKMVTCHVCMQSIQMEGDAVVMTADAVICGSGAGGGVAAALLAEAGAKAGPFSISSPTLCHWSSHPSSICRRALQPSSRQWLMWGYCANGRMTMVQSTL